MKNSKLAALLTCFVLAGSLVMANDGKSKCFPLEGYVKDAVTKKPVPGVTVSVMPVGTHDQKEVVTDGEGFFHFADIPTQEFNIQFGKKGYQSYKKGGLMAREKTCLKVNIEFYRDEEVGSSDSESEYPLLRMLDLN
jgi:hypothetical protein